ncbi:MAG TPA: hypothetical protein VI336_02495 [Candidatus Saccharimonadales bacterium]|nr:hypothetical protein [Candidatus Saccharimonadales bacterium]
MKSFKLWLVALFVSTLAVSVFSLASVSAQTGGILQCVQEEPIDNCDLGIKKEVSVNGGTFLDANASAEAANAVVGDTVTWRITVDREGTDFDGFPVGTIIVGDNLPSGVTYISTSTSDGSTYDESSDIWQFTLDIPTTYPVTLTINTTAAGIGLAQNIAFLSGYICDVSDFCEDSGEYSDSNRLNNGDEAWVNISAAPVVLAESTPVVLAATDSGITESLVAAGLIAATLGTLGYSRFARKNS